MQITISDVTGQVLRTLQGPGTYLVTLRAGNRELASIVTVLEDIWLKEW